MASYAGAGEVKGEPTAGSSAVEVGTFEQHKVLCRMSFIAVQICVHFMPLTGAVYLSGALKRSP